MDQSIAHAPPETPADPGPINALLAHIRATENITDPLHVIRLAQLKRWVARAGGADVEYRAPDNRGYMLTRRGHTVAAEARR